jgi:hypothetical protein
MTHTTGVSIADEGKLDAAAVEPGDESDRSFDGDSDVLVGACDKSAVGRCAPDGAHAHNYAARLAPLTP